MKFACLTMLKLSAYLTMKGSKITTFVLLENSFAQTFTGCNITQRTIQTHNFQPVHNKN